MDAHRVEILDRADDDAVVGLVADDLDLELLPAEEGFLDENLGGGGHVETAARDGFEFLTVIGDPSARSAQGEGGTDDERVSADVFGDLEDLVDRVGGTRFGYLQADLDHDLLEEGAVLAALDRLGVGADQPHLVLLEDAAVDQFHRRIECRLSAEGGEKGVGFLPLDDSLDDRGGDRLDVGSPRELRVGHDGGRIGVHQHHIVSFLGERLAGLDA